MRKRGHKQTLIMIIILVLSLMGMGYAYLNTDLNIDGLSNVNKNTWNVYWDNVQVAPGSVPEEQVITAPTISNQTTVSFQVRLKEPGEYYEFDIDAKNAGSLDAMIENVNYTINNSSTASLPPYLKISLTCEGIPVEPNQLLRAGQKRTYNVQVAFRDDINPDNLPTEPRTVTFNVTLPYVQADDNAIPLDVVYDASSIFSKIGEPIPNGVTTYDNYQSAINSFGGNPFFIKHVLQDNKVAASYVGFVYKGNTYYIRGGDNGASYQQNIATMTKAFGSNNCSYMGNAFYLCRDTVERIMAITCQSGCADAHGDEYICESDEYQQSACYECNGQCFSIDW